MKKDTPRKWRGAGVVVYTKNPLTAEHLMKVRSGNAVLEQNGTQAIEILVGIETKYLSDYTRDYITLETCKASNEEEAFAAFERRAIELSEQLNTYITFDKPIEKEKGWHVNFRVTPRAPDVANYGIPKGTKELKDISDKDTANRELEEETGIYASIPRDATPFTTDRDYVFYALELNKKEAEEQIRLHSQQHYHELHQVKFIPLNEIFTHHVNGLSRKVIKDFERLINKPH